MTLGTYPLVYLPVAAALRRADPSMEEAAHSLGVGRAATFFRVTLPLVRTAIFGGCVLVVLTVISEYGAFEILGYQTFTTEIFTEFQFDSRAAGALAIPLVLLGLLVLLTEGLIPRRTVTGSAPRRAVRPARLRRLTVPAMLAIAALVALGVGVPVGTIVYWMATSQHTTFPATATVATATWTTLSYSAAAAAVAVVLALPVALVSFRRSTVPRAVLERSTYVTKALPGVVIALSLVFFATRYVFGLYETSALLVAAYVILYFPLALVCVKASVAHVPPRLTDVGRSLGRGPVAVFMRVTLPLLAPGAAGRVLPGLPHRGDRAHGDARAGPDRRPDARHSVLGLPAEHRLQRRRALRAGDGRARRSSPARCWDCGLTASGDAHCSA